MDRLRRRLQVVGGFLVGLLALVLFGSVVGFGEVLRIFSGLSPLPFAVGIVTAFAAVGARYLALLALLDRSVSTGSLLGYLRGVYGRQLLPIGNVTGPVVIAYSLRSVTGIPVQRGFAATLTAELATLVGWAVVAFVGSLWLVAGGVDAMLPVAGAFGILLLLTLALLVGVVAGLDVDRAIHRCASVVHRTLGSLSTTIARRTNPEAVATSLEEFGDAQRLIRIAPYRVAVAMGWSVVGWALFVLPALAVADAVGVAVPLAVVFVAVPLSDLFNALPIPGGIGGVEAALAGVLVALTGLDLAVAAVIAFAFRLCTFWFVLLVGGVATTILSIRGRSHGAS